MSCSQHHSCICRDDLMIEAIEALVSLVNGIDKYRASLAPHDRITLAHFIHAMPSAKSVINRSRQSKTS